MVDAALFSLPAPSPDPTIALAAVGTQVDTDQGPFGLATATFNEARTHRFRLSRVWDDALPRVNFIMLNPSTADALKLDPTVRRCVGFAKLWGAGSLEVTNVFALRSTDPRALLSDPDPVGPGNDDAIVAAASAADIIIVAWGVHAKGRGLEVSEILRSHHLKANALRLTKEGTPAHPLYVPSKVTPVPFV